MGQWRTTHDAEHGWTELTAGDPGWADTSWAGTVFVPATVFGRGEVAVVATARPDLLPEGARLFRFPGSDRLPTELTVTALLETTAVDEVVSLGGAPVRADGVVRTQDFLRPVMTLGRLRLQVRPGSRSTLVGFEQPHPTPCCSDH